MSAHWSSCLSVQCPVLHSNRYLEVTIELLEQVFTPRLICLTMSWSQEHNSSTKGRSSPSWRRRYGFRVQGNDSEDEALSRSKQTLLPENLVAARISKCGKGVFSLKIESTPESLGQRQCVIARMKTALQISTRPIHHKLHQNRSL